MKAGCIASQAAELVSGDREHQHGDKRDNFERIATLVNAYLRIRRDPVAPLDAVDVGHIMVLTKLARTQSGSMNVDDWIDLCGYAACAGDLASEA
ncbi:DUF6378 domain-containing protein [Chelatococcus sp.]|uniref:DUF6378 domain-containing protein n=1 Tax=Chelatococcus sp. TaxID=1953771 RepID=UPI001EBD76A7|nr:DUF6378 domain-containing protein [Chelatococcus sp.]MBX3543731.1 hypothetical protein [Chelatococcus sp.]CAH1677667.1 hypothetical protein CHELA41_24426 [Hyphomicrobiales bacterium]